MTGRAMQQSNRLLDQFRNLLPTSNLRDIPTNYHYAMSQATKERCEVIIWEALLEEYDVSITNARKNFGYVRPFPKLNRICAMYGLSIVIDEGLPLGKIVMRKMEAMQ